MDQKRSFTACAPSTVPWRSRIIGYGQVPPEGLRGNPSNPRTHPRKQLAALNDILDELGWISAIVVNQSSGLILDGHARVDLARKHREPVVPVVYVDLTPEAEAEALAVFDPIGGLAGTDHGKLEELLGDLQAADAPLLDLIESVAWHTLQDADLARGLLPEEKLEIYEANPVRHIVLHFDAQEYAYVLQALAWLHGHFGVATHAEAVQRLLQAELVRRRGPPWESFGMAAHATAELGEAAVDG